MKNSNMKHLFFLISFTLAAQFITSGFAGTDLPLLKKSYFGVQLGQNINVFKNILAKKNVSYKEGKDENIAYLEFSKGLVNNQSIKKTKIYHYRGTIFQVWVEILNPSDIRFMELQKFLGQKYQKKGATLSEVHYEHKINARTVEVDLYLNESEMVLIYTYLDLQRLIAMDEKYEHISDLLTLEAHL